MTQWQNGAPISDEVLVAWLDKQLTVQQHQQVEKMLSDDPELAERLAELDRASVDFSAAFAPLLQEAPKDRLQQSSAPHWRSRRSRRLQASAAEP